MLGEGVDVQLPWEPAASANHSAVFDVFPLYVDANLTTNADFRDFVAATGYNASSAGLDPANFLRHWVEYANGTVSFNESNDDGPRPVVWVAPADAQAFCAWRGKRLPSEWELQFAGMGLAAGGSDYRAFPWGNASCASFGDGAARPCAAGDNSSAPRSPDFAGANAAGASDCGVRDLVGLVWQLTGDAYCDDLACRAVLRGGSFYAPIAGGSDAGGAPPAAAYAPSAEAAANGRHYVVPFADEAGLRGALVGFRCVADSAPSRAAREALQAQAQAQARRGSKGRRR